MRYTIWTQDFPDELLSLLYFQSTVDKEKTAWFSQFIYDYNFKTYLNPNPSDKLYRFRSISVFYADFTALPHCNSSHLATAKPNILVPSPWCNFPGIPLFSITSLDVSMSFFSIAIRSFPFYFPEHPIFILLPPFESSPVKPLTAPSSAVFFLPL